VARLRARFDRASQEPSVDCCRSPARCSRSSPDSFLMLTILFYLLRDDGNCVGGSTSIDHDDDIVSYTQAVDDDLETVFLSNLAVILVAATAAVVTYYGLNFVASGGTVVGTPVLLSCSSGSGR